MLAESGVLAVTNLTAETNPPQGLTEKSFNSVKLELPSFLPLTTPPSIDRHQADSPRLPLCRNDWDSKIKANYASERA